MNRYEAWRISGERAQVWAMKYEHFLELIWEVLFFVLKNIPAVNFCKTVNLILEESIMDKNYKPITSMKEVPEQLRKLRWQYLRYQQAEIIYSISHKKLFELASDAGALYRIDGTVLINRDIFDTYLERFHEPATGKGREEMMDER